MGLERRGRTDQGQPEANPAGEEPKERPKPKVKSFEIPKRLVYEAWEKVRANKGAPGVDAVSIAGFADDERDNLYKLWNRLSSGSYMPGPVRAVEIPKDHGAGVRILGVPNTADRVAQTAAAMLLEEKLEPIFHPDSYGYRPGRSAHDALAVARKRCWKQDWVLDLDVRAFFDSVPHDLLLKAVAHHTDERWVLLYIERWLKAPMQMPDGTLIAREKGTPQGSPISPLLANLFMHYAFDRWMDREFPDCPFERYADDIIAHCDTEEQARHLRASIAERLGTLGLELHPEKTKVAYCKDAQRRGTSEHTSFDFLGYTFRARRAHGKRGLFVSFLPAMSNKARKAKGQQIRAWHLNRRSGTDLSGLAEDINPQVRGWINYYGAFYRSALTSLATRIDEHLVRWAMQKFKRLRDRPNKAWAWLRAVREREPNLFAHWHLIARTDGRFVGAG
ncbi:MAG TPA: group II intron reverse transcriptase/maturase [Egibacteraceae bacterium]|jgi:RNA-directed DNA polymerase|nr:group II intron reverse transcriptase/maturase [Egibacteraceae bacterium]